MDRETNSGAETGLQVFFELVTHSQRCDPETQSSSQPVRYDLEVSWNVLRALWEYISNLENSCCVVVQVILFFTTANFVSKIPKSCCNVFNFACTTLKES